MGLLSWLSGPRVKFSAKVWQLCDAKRQAIPKLLRDELNQRHKVILLHTFQDTLAWLREALPDAHEMRRPSRRDLQNPPASVSLLQIEDVPENLAHARSSTTSIRVHQAEFSPVTDLDDRLFTLASFFGQSQITTYVSLDEAWFAPFGVERIKALLERFGFGDEELMEGELLGKTFLNARKRIAESCRRPLLLGESCEAWMKANASYYGAH